MKTFNEYNKSKEQSLDEATVAQWGKRAAGLGALAGAILGITGAVAGVGVTGGLSIAVPIAAWASVSMGINGLIAGALFAGGQARKDYAELKKLMKKIEKYQSMKPEDVTDKKAREFKRDLKRALFLVKKLKRDINSELDIASSKGILRSDLRQTDEFIEGLSNIEGSLDEIVSALEQK